MAVSVSGIYSSVFFDLPAVHIKRSAIDGYAVVRTLGSVPDRTFVFVIIKIQGRTAFDCDRIITADACDRMAIQAKIRLSFRYIPRFIQSNIGSKVVASCLIRKPSCICPGLEVDSIMPVCSVISNRISSISGRDEFFISLPFKTVLCRLIEETVIQSDRRVASFNCSSDINFAAFAFFSYCQKRPCTGHKTMIASFDRSAVDGDLCVFRNIETGRSVDLSVIHREPDPGIAAVRCDLSICIINDGTAVHIDRTGRIKNIDPVFLIS